MLCKIRSSAGMFPHYRPVKNFEKPHRPLNHFGGGRGGIATTPTQSVSPTTQKNLRFFKNAIFLLLNASNCRFYNIIILYLLNRYCVDLFCPCRIGKEGVTPHPDAGSSRGGKGKDNPPAGIHGFRIKCGMTEPSQRGMTERRDPA